jgi:hypothetical protein
MELQLTLFRLPDYYTGDTIQYFGNIELGGIYKIFDGKPMVSVSLMASLNSTDRNYISGLQTGFNSNAIKPGAGVMWSLQQGVVAILSWC